MNSRDAALAPKRSASVLVLAMEWTRNSVRVSACTDGAPQEKNSTDYSQTRPHLLQRPPESKVDPRSHLSFDDAGRRASYTWQVGHQKRLRPSMTSVRMGVPHTRHGSPARRYT